MTLAPEYLERLRTNVPVALQEARRWVASRGKKPISPVTGDGRGWDDGEERWTNLDAAADFASRRDDIDGLGIVLAEGDDLVLLDADDVVLDDGDVEPWWQRIREQCSSYTERSMSGRGEHILLAARWQEGWRTNERKANGAGGGSLEMYGRKRWVRLTGDLIDGSPREVADAPEGLLEKIQHERMIRGGDGPKRRRESPRSDREAAQGDVPRPVRRLVDSALENAVRQIAGAREGDRNNELNRGAFRMGRFVGASLIAEERSREELRSAGLAAGLDRGEVEATVDSGLRAGKADPVDAGLIDQWLATAGDIKSHDFHVADSFAEEHGNITRYCAEEKRWYMWDGRRWVPDSSHRVDELARKTLEGLASDADYIASKREDSSGEARLRAIANRFRAAKKLRICLAARGESRRAG